MLKAVHWALNHVREKSRRDSVAVFFKCTKKSRLAKSYESDESVNIPLKDIVICSFEAKMPIVSSTKLFSSNSSAVSKEDRAHLAIA